MNSRGNHVYEIHKFIIAKIAYHSKNLTPENQNLLDELLECLAKEDVLRFQKMTLMELKPQILRWMNILKDDLTQVTYLNYL